MRTHPIGHSSSGSRGGHTLRPPKKFSILRSSTVFHSFLVWGSFRGGRGAQRVVWVA